MRAPPRLLSYCIAAISGVAVGYGWLDDSSASEPTLASVIPPWIAPLPQPKELALVRAITQSAPTEPPADRQAKPPDPPDSWTLRQEQSAFEDLTNVYLSVPSDAPLACGPKRRASLMLRCLEDRTSAYIAHDCATPPGNPDGWQVEVLMDDGPVRAMWMEVDTLGEAFGHWQYRQARTFIEGLLPARSLHVRFVDVTGVTAQMRFNVADLRPGLTTLRAACHWSDIPPWMAGPEGTALPYPAVEAVAPTSPRQLPTKRVGITATLAISARAAEQTARTTRRTGPTTPVRRLPGEYPLSENARSNPPMP